jgi:hypothetical protein
MGKVSENTGDDKINHEKHNIFILQLKEIVKTGCIHEMGAAKQITPAYE